MRSSPAGFAHIFILVGIVIFGALASAIGMREFKLPETRALEDPAGPPWPQIPSGLSRSMAIRAGDVLAVRVDGEDDMSGEFRVDDAGAIRLPMAGAVTVTGLEMREAAQRVTTVLADGFLAHPEVAISRISAESHSVFVIGHVLRPGVISLTGELSLGRVLSLAGGTTSGAARSALVIRPAAPSTRPAPIDDPAARAFTFDLAADAEELLHDGDTIYIRAGGLIAVMGAVRDPGLYTFEPDMTVTVALARAGGLRDGATARRAQISRFVNGERRTIDVDAVAVLTPGDVLTVRGRRFLF